VARAGSVRCRRAVPGARRRGAPLLEVRRRSTVPPPPGRAPSATRVSPPTTFLRDRPRRVRRAGRRVPAAGRRPNRPLLAGCTRLTPVRVLLDCEPLRGRARAALSSSGGGPIVVPDPKPVLTRATSSSMRSPPGAVAPRALRRDARAEAVRLLDSRRLPTALPTVNPSELSGAIAISSSHRAALSAEPHLARVRQVPRARLLGPGGGAELRLAPRGARLATLFITHDHRRRCERWDRVLLLQHGRVCSREPWTTPSRLRRTRTPARSSPPRRAGRSAGVTLLPAARCAAPGLRTVADGLDHPECGLLFPARRRAARRRRGGAALPLPARRRRRRLVARSTALSSPGVCADGDGNSYACDVTAAASTASSPDGLVSATASRSATRTSRTRRGLDAVGVWHHATGARHRRPSWRSARAARPAAAGSASRSRRAGLAATDVSTWSSRRGRRVLLVAARRRRG